ncbi:hypothetical protein MAM1_0182d07418 [Mucor ambiguus]|uniref:Uncharacterized protein n=1 Tax=Mucor ambiguus TaxID=91626 RepID=A0A0C9N016_9FUNG|nr:hypothetical protein MAM1_0182d07418 [Mucor ambiguus]
MMKNGIFVLCVGFFDALLGEPRQWLILGAALPSWCFFGGAIRCCSLVATFMMLSFGARCCCGCRSLAVLAILSLGNFVLFAAAVAVAVYLLLSWCCCLVGACFCCLLSFTCCLGAVYCCCCCSFIIAVLVMHSLGKLVQFTAAVAVYLISWRLLGVRFCCCCRSFAVLVMLYRINLVLSAAASIYCWLS